MENILQLELYPREKHKAPRNLNKKTLTNEIAK
jgi:hypothetical protein